MGKVKVLVQSLKNDFIFVKQKTLPDLPPI